MNFIENIFSQSKIIFLKLEPYGFQKQNDKYILTKNILNDQLKVIIEINQNGNINGKIYDLAFQEEYINYRIKNQNGKFVNMVRDEYKSILEDIRKNCCESQYFSSMQANRLTNYIINKYATYPEFVFSSSKTDAIFRNPKNNKWFGLIMRVNKNKITTGNTNVNILNIKLAPDKIEKLLNQKGYYKAYHMNKKNWLTIILDDLIDDDKIYAYIDESYNLTN